MSALKILTEYQTQQRAYERVEGIKHLPDKEILKDTLEKRMANLELEFERELVKIMKKYEQPKPKKY